MAPEFTRSSQAALHLVVHEQGVGFVANRSQASQELGVGGVNATFALHRLDEHGARATFDDHLTRFFQVTVRRERVPRKSRGERRAVALLPRQRKRAERSAVKTVFKTHRLPRRVVGVFPQRLRARFGVLSREFQRPLVRLRSRVAKEDSVGERRRRELSRERRPRFGVIQVRRVRQRARLFGDHSRHAFIRVSEAIHRDPAREI
mmetsp:Transcript_5110/g.19773  ORF Transcript_5110/g.19773 Transcript_5110/m.19773 type:complete len:205 (+) Transcript_5110:653-1267(+)